MSDSAHSEMPRGLMCGLSYAPRGLSFTLRRPRMLLIALVPLLINLVLLIGAFALGLRFYDSAFATAYPFVKPEAWWMAAAWWAGYWVVRGVLYLLLAVVSLLVVVALGSVIAAPFHEALSERTERALRPHLPASPFSFAHAFGEVAAALRDQIILLSIYFAGLIVIVLLNLIPVAGAVLSSVLSFAWTCWFFTLEFTEPPLARWGLRWRQRWKLLASNLRLAFGFGVGAWLLLLIPLTMPFLVVSATLMACDMQPARSPNKPAPGEDDKTAPHGDDERSTLTPA